MNNIKEISKLLTFINKKKVFNVLSGYGSFFEIFLNKPKLVEVKTAKGIKSFVRGEWHINVYMSAWRIEKDKIFVVGCGDSKTKTSSELKKLIGKTILSTEVANEALDTYINFDDGSVLRIFNINSEEEKSWTLCTPDDMLLKVGPANRWSYEAYT